MERGSEVVSLGLGLGIASLLFDVGSSLSLPSMTNLISLLFFYVIVWIIAVAAIVVFIQGCKKLISEKKIQTVIIPGIFFFLMWLNVAHWMNRKIFKLLWLRKLTLFGKTIPAGVLSLKVWVWNIVLLGAFIGLTIIIVIAYKKLSKKWRERVVAYRYPILMFSILLPVGLGKNYLILWGSYSLGGLVLKFALIIGLSAVFGFGITRFTSKWAVPILLTILVFSGGIYFLISDSSERAWISQASVEAAAGQAPLRMITDRDGDGFSTFIGMVDCDDRNPLVNVLGNDIPGDRIDQDCLGGDATKIQIAEGHDGCLNEQCDPQMNILVLIIDAANAEHLSLYGYERDTTPFMDELASRSMVFDRAIAPSPWTPTSVVSLVTGLSPSAHGVFYLRADTLDAKVPTLPKILSDAGYQTAGFTALDPAITSRYMGLWDDFDHFDESFYYEPGGLPYLRGDKMIEKMEAWLKGRDKDKPFFMLSHFDDLHLPYHPLPPYDTMFGDSSGKINYDSSSMTDEDLSYMIQLFDGSLRYLDDQFKSFFEQLEEEVTGDTIIIITADHGEEFMTHGGIGHARTLYQDSLRVPLIIHIPSFTPGRNTDSVGLVDISPTILDYLGIDQPLMEGRSLIPHMTEREYERREYSLEVRNKAFGSNYALMGVTSWPYKYILNTETGQEELYDLGSDPNELANIIDVQKDKAEKLRTLLSNRRSAQLALHDEITGG